MNTKHFTYICVIDSIRVFFLSLTDYNENNGDYDRIGKAPVKRTDPPVRILFDFLSSAQPNLILLLTFLIIFFDNDKGLSLEAGTLVHLLAGDGDGRERAGYCYISARRVIVIEPCRRVANCAIEVDLKVFFFIKMIYMFLTYTHTHTHIHIQTNQCTCALFIFVVVAIEHCMSKFVRLMNRHCFFFFR